MIGCLRHDHALPAYLATDPLLGKNLAILGSTGSGKSCAVTVVLRSLLSAIHAPTSSCSIRTTSMPPHFDDGRFASIRAISSCPTGC